MIRRIPQDEHCPHNNVLSLQQLGGSGALRQVWESRRVAIPVDTTLTPERRKDGMMALAKKFWDDESGQGLAEYALLLGLIVIGVVVLIQGMGISIQKIFTKANSDLATAASGLP